MEEKKELKKEFGGDVIEVITAVKDEAANSFMELRTTATCAVAIRSFAEFVQANKFIMKNAKDFNLYFLGNWNKTTGELVIHTPSTIAQASEFTIENKGEQKNG